MQSTIHESQKLNATWRVLLLLRNRCKAIGLLGMLIITATTLDICVPLLTQRLLDGLMNRFLGKNDLDLYWFLGKIVGTIFVITIFSRAMKSSYDYKIFELATSTEDMISNAATKKYLHLHVQFHNGSNSGQIIGRIERGATSIFNIIYDIIGHKMIPPLLIFAGVVCVLVRTNYWMSLVVLLPLPLYLLSVNKMTKKIYKIEQQSNDQFEAVSKAAYDIAGNILTVKKFSREQEETDLISNLRKKARLTQLDAELIWAKIEITQTFIAASGKAAVLFIAGFLIILHKISFGELVASLQLYNMAYNPLSELSVIFPRLRRNISRVERLFRILDEPELVRDVKNSTSLKPFSGAIEFKNVSFRYKDDGPWVLRDVNVKIRAGDTVALVGRSGSGKTTFANLLVRSYDPQEGVISIDGQDIRTVTKRSLCEQIAFVPQEVDLFSRTIAQNIAYGNSELSHEEITKASKHAFAHRFIKNTDLGYKTTVGERGLKLSGGQRQRVGIARAIAKNAPIIIFDEATSHLDTESEQLIQEAVKRMSEGRTLIVIAHRLSTIKSADMIIVFTDNTIEAMGSHANLLKISSTYQTLHSLQFNTE